MAGMAFVHDGILFRVVEGDKFPGDLVLEWKTPAGWQRVKMASAFLLTDFLVENEAERALHMPGWRETARDFFFRHLDLAVRRGWRVAANTVADQRERRSETFDPLSVDF